MSAPPPPAPPSRREASPYPKADLLLRGLARFTDLVFALAVANVSREVGPPIAALYLALADGLLQGQSFGKRIFGIRAVVLPPPGGARGAPAGFRESMLRNAPFALVALFYGLAVWGWVLLAVVGLPVLAYEAWRVHTDPLGIRLGDVFADTQVVDGKMSARADVPAPAGDPLGPVRADLGVAPVPPGSAASPARREARAAA